MGKVMTTVGMVGAAVAAEKVGESVGESVKTIKDSAKKISKNTADTPPVIEADAKVVKQSSNTNRLVDKGFYDAPENDDYFKEFEDDIFFPAFSGMSVRNVRSGSKTFKSCINYDNALEFLKQVDSKSITHQSDEWSKTRDQLLKETPGTRVWRQGIVLLLGWMHGRVWNPSTQTLDQHSFVEVHGFTGTADEEASFCLIDGVTALYGKMKTAKSLLVHYLRMMMVNDEFDTEYERIGEPEFPAIIDPMDGIFCLQDFLNSKGKYKRAKVLLYDSMRQHHFLKSEVGSTGSGGVNNSIYLDFTDLNQLAMAAGKIIITVINPMSSSDGKTGTSKSDGVAESLESSVTGFINALRPGVFTYNARSIKSGRMDKQFDFPIERVLGNLTIQEKEDLKKEVEADIAKLSEQSFTIGESEDSGFNGLQKLWGKL